MWHAAGDNGDMIVMHSLRDYDAEKSAGRMAVQAAAGALMSVTGHTCEDIVMCSTSREWDDMLEVSSAARPQRRLSSSSGICLHMQHCHFAQCFWYLPTYGRLLVCPVLLNTVLLDCSTSSL